MEIGKIYLPSPCPPLFLLPFGEITVIWALYLPIYSNKTKKDGETRALSPMLGASGALGTSSLHMYSGRVICSGMVTSLVLFRALLWHLHIPPHFMASLQSPLLRFCSSPPKWEMCFSEIAAYYHHASASPEPLAITWFTYDRK